MELSEIAAAEAFSALNDAGMGYAVGDESQSPREAVTAEGWAYLGTSGDLVLARSPEGLVIVGNVHGPWAVTWDRHEVAAELAKDGGYVMRAGRHVWHDETGEVDGAEVLCEPDEPGEPWVWRVVASDFSNLPGDGAAPSANDIRCAVMAAMRAS